MSYTVVWASGAEDGLADLWVNAPDRDAVAAAADAIDARLRRDPYAASESREGTTRVTFEAPLAVLYEVSDADRRVTVLDVWRFE